MNPLAMVAMKQRVEKNVTLPLHSPSPNSGPDFPDEDFLDEKECRVLKGLMGLEKPPVKERGGVGSVGISLDELANSVRGGRGR